MLHKQCLTNMDFETAILQAVRQIPRVREAGLEPSLDDRLIGSRLGLDSFDFAELVVILSIQFPKDPFEQQGPRRDRLETLRDLAQSYLRANADSSTGRSGSE